MSGNGSKRETSSEKICLKILTDLIKMMGIRCGTRRNKDLLGRMDKRQDGRKVERRRKDTRKKRRNIAKYYLKLAISKVNVFLFLNWEGEQDELPIKHVIWCLKIR